MVARVMRALAVTRAVLLGAHNGFHFLGSAVVIHIHRKSVVVFRDYIQEGVAGSEVGAERATKLGQEHLGNVGINGHAQKSAQVAVADCQQRPVRGDQCWIENCH